MERGTGWLSRVEFSCRDYIMQSLRQRNPRRQARASPLPADCSRAPKQADLLVCRAFEKQWELVEIPRAIQTLFGVSQSRSQHFSALALRCSLSSPRLSQAHRDYHQLDSNSRTATCTVQLHAHRLKLTSVRAQHIQRPHSAALPPRPSPQPPSSHYSPSPPSNVRRKSRGEVHAHHRRR